MKKNEILRALAAAIDESQIYRTEFPAVSQGVSYDVVKMTTADNEILLVDETHDNPTAVRVASLPASHVFLLWREALERKGRILNTSRDINGDIIHVNAEQWSRQATEYLEAVEAAFFDNSVRSVAEEEVLRLVAEIFDALIKEGSEPKVTLTPEADEFPFLIRMDEFLGFCVDEAFSVSTLTLLDRSGEDLIVEAAEVGGDKKAVLEFHRGGVEWSSDDEDYKRPVLIVDDFIFDLERHLTAIANGI